MRKEYNMMVTIVVCGIMGLISAVIVTQLYTNGYITSLLMNGMTIGDLQFLVFFIWIIFGLVAGVMRN